MEPGNVAEISLWHVEPKLAGEFCHTLWRWYWPWVLGPAGRDPTHFKIRKMADILEVQLVVLNIIVILAGRLQV